MKKDIQKQLTVSCGISEAWAALTNPEIISQWFLATNNFKAEEGAGISFNDQNRKITGEILTCQEPINLAYSWVDPSSQHTTYVWWKLLEKDGETLIEMDHSGFKGLMGAWSWFSYGSFWSKYLKKLKKHIETKVVA